MSMNIQGTAWLPSSSWESSIATPRATSSAAQQAQEFESVFVSMLLKEMRQSSLSEGGLFPGDSSDTYGGLFDMTFGKHIAQAGGLGLAGMIENAIAGGAAAPTGGLPL